MLFRSVTRASAIWGPSIPALKGRTVRARPSPPPQHMSGVRLLSAESPAADLVRYIELSDCEKAPILRKFKNVFNENLNYRKG